MSENQTTLTLTISTTKRSLIDKVKDKVNNTLLNLENRGDILFWDIQEGDSE